MPINSRDLTRFDNGGSFKFSRTVPQSDQNEARAKIREFVWDHWVKKRAGHISLAFWSAADDPSSYDLYIERDISGTWGVTYEYERQCCIERTRQNPKIGIEINTGTLYYMSLERRETIPGIEFNGEDVPLDAAVYGKLVPDRQKLPGKDFVLLFRKEKQGQADWLL
ncbi:MAG: hypothetical protein ACRD43_03385 [Pyrinomonadaceae bacterium]